MPDSDFSTHPLVAALTDTIDALTVARESGTKMVPVNEQVWRDLCTPPRPRPAPMPQVPEPARAERLPAGRAPETPADREHILSLLRTEIAACTRCRYAAADRIAAAGSPYNPLIAVVNSPCLQGDSATACGSRLEGEAGVLLHKMFAAIGLAPDQLYITSALKCAITGKADPIALKHCSDLLRKELKLVQPQVIVLLGAVAARTLYPTGVAATGQVGVWNLLEGTIPTMTLHHPMRLLLLGDELSIPLKRENWSALQAIKKRLTP